MSKRILVIGGTGMLGEPVARRLQADGFTVRVLSSHVLENKAGKIFDNRFELVKGNVIHDWTLEEAFEGCWGVHISLGGWTSTEAMNFVENQGTGNAIKAAKKAGVTRLSMISYAAELERYPKSPYASIKHLAENHVMNSGLEWTLFKATHFMESLKFYIKWNRAWVFGNQPHRFHWVAAEDYARMVSTAFQKEEAAGKRFTLFGPEAKTFEKALKQYIQEIYSSGSVVNLPLWMIKIIGGLTSSPDTGYYSDLMKFFSEAGEQGDPDEANELLGAPTTTLEEWLSKQK